MRFTLFTFFAALFALLATALAVPVAPAHPGSLMGRRFVVSERDAPRALAAAAVRANPVTTRKVAAEESRADRFQKRLAQRAGLKERSGEREQAEAPRKLAIAARKARALGRQARREMERAQ
ncbi:hypothetical protein EV714DRAFT_253525 [Schizophyllum commune]